MVMEDVECLELNRNFMRDHEPALTQSPRLKMQLMIDSEDGAVENIFCPYYRRTHRLIQV
jgi:hypothetical protein